MIARAACCPACGATYLIKEGCLRCNPLPPARGRKYTRKGIESPEAQETRELKRRASAVGACQLSLGI